MRWPEYARRHKSKTVDLVVSSRSPAYPLAYLLDIYDSMRRGQSRGFHVEPISNIEVWAWQQNHERILDPFEVMVLEALDGKWLESLPKDDQSDKPSRQ